MREQLTALRALMAEEGIDLYLIPSEDYHHSEYVNDYFKCREYYSGFTGDAGTLLVGAENAWLWTDGRFFLQGAEQLAGSGIELMKSGEEGVPTLTEFLQAQSTEVRLTLGFDGRLITAR